MMSIPDEISEKKKPVPLSPDEKVKSAFQLYCDVAFLMVSPSQYASDTSKMSAISAYLYGVCNALAQMHHLTTIEQYSDCYALIFKRFPYLLTPEMKKLFPSFLHGKTSKEFQGFIQAGGQSVVEWSNGNILAPTKLANILDDFPSSEHISMELKPKDAKDYDELVIDHGKQDNYNQETSDYTKTIVIYPKDAMDYCHRGNTYDDLGNQDLAIKVYNKAIELKPQNKLAYYDKGGVREWGIKLQEIWDDYKGYIIISISIIILLAGILLTLSNLNKSKEPLSVTAPQVEVPVAQPVQAPEPASVQAPAPEPTPVPDQPTDQTSNEDLERIAKEENLNIIRSAHPDFDNLRDSGKIVAWIQKQPSNLRDSMLKTYVKGDADSMIALLNQFKKDKNRTQVSKGKVKIPKKNIPVTRRPVASKENYKPIGVLKGIELQNGNVIEGQIISFKGDTLKIRTKDGKILTYSFMKEVKSFIY